jgi:hypothetical protein
MMEGEREKKRREREWVIKKGKWKNEPRNGQIL